MTRYHRQSVRLLRDAMSEARQGRWLRCEELLWGSATLAVKGVALSRSDEVDSRQAVEEYAQGLGREHNDRRIRDAFSRLSSFADAADRMRESRADAQRLVAILEDVASAVERLWDMLPPNDALDVQDFLYETDSPDHNDEPTPDEPPPPWARRSARPRRLRQRRINRDDDE